MQRAPTPEPQFWAAEETAGSSSRRRLSPQPHGEEDWVPSSQFYRHTRHPQGAHTNMQAEHP